MILTAKEREVLSGGYTDISHNFIDRFLSVLVLDGRVKHCDIERKMSCSRPARDHGLSVARQHGLIMRLVNISANNKPTSIYTITEQGRKHLLSRCIDPAVDIGSRSRDDRKNKIAKLKRIQRLLTKNNGSVSAHSRLIRRFQDIVLRGM